MIPVGLKLKVDGSEFQSGMDKAIGGLSSRIAAMFSVGAMVQFGRSIKSMVDTIKDTSDAVGMSAESFQELNYAFMQTGVGADKFLSAMKSLSQVRQAAIGGDNSAIEKLRQYGISLRSVKESSPDEMFSLIAKSIASIPDPMSRAAAATELFGKSGINLIPALIELEKLRNESKGKILSNKDIDDLDKASDKLDVLINKSKVLGAKSFLGIYDGLFGGGIGETFQNMPKDKQNSSGMMQQTIRGLMSMFGDNVEGKSLASLKETLAIIEKRKKAIESGPYVGDVFNEEDDYFNSKAYVNALNASQMPDASSGLSSSKLILPEARAAIGLTQLQQVGAFAPTADAQAQVVPLLQKQLKAMEQAVRELQENRISLKV